MRWFRLYDDVLNDPKVQRLDGDTFKFWINMLCIASKRGGVLPSIEDMAFEMRVSVLVCTMKIDALKTAGLVDGDKRLRPHGWEKRQYKSDTSTERVKRFRERSSNVAVTVDETGPDTDTETEQKQRNKRVIMPRGTRLSETWVPSEDDLSFARQLGVDGNSEAERFRDYWIAQPGQKGTKVNWTSTWRNWCRNAKPTRASTVNSMVNELLEWSKDKENESRISNESDFNPFGLLSEHKSR